MTEATGTNGTRKRGYSPKGKRNTGWSPQKRREFADWLRAAIFEARMTTAEVGKLVDVDATTISNWARGENIPTKPHYDALVGLFGAPRKVQRVLVDTKPIPEPPIVSAIVHNIVVDKGVPMPEKYPFSVMCVGDSFFAVGERMVEMNAEIANWNAKNGSRTGWKFVATPVEGGVRCWRVA
jgi:transcriptional regulator with XRE-family HTH domain